jgi:hypothetical protein
MNPLGAQFTATKSVEMMVRLQGTAPFPANNRILEPEMKQNHVNENHHDIVGIIVDNPDKGHRFHVTDTRTVLQEIAPMIAIIHIIIRMHVCLKLTANDCKEREK